MAQQLAARERLGGLPALGTAALDNMYHAGWASAGNTRFRHTKIIASHLGGTRNPLAMSWPARIRPDPRPRMQFHHVNDAAPTIYEILGKEQPLAPGRHVVRAEFAVEGDRPGSGGTLTLFADDRRIGEGRIGRIMPAWLQIDEGLGIGLDDRTPLIEAYADRMPFRLDGLIGRVTIDLR